jgi:hypothetical protein
MNGRNGQNEQTGQNWQNGKISGHAEREFEVCVPVIDGGFGSG